MLLWLTLYPIALIRSGVLAILSAIGLKLSDLCVLQQSVMPGNGAIPFSEELKNLSSLQMLTKI